MLSNRFSPFGKYKIKDYFKRIEFQHCRCPHAYILFWLDNALVDVFGQDYSKVIKFMKPWISVSPKNASGCIKLQIYKYTFICYKKVMPNKNQQYRFEALFIPARQTMILIPIKKKNKEGFTNYSKQISRNKN